MELKKRFENLGMELKFIFEWIDNEWSEIDKQYSSNYRKYHNLNHLTELFLLFDVYQKELKYPEEVSLAIFYHDIYYKIRESQNEKKSAEIAKLALQKTSLNPEKIKRIVNLILSTKTHVANNQDEKWLIDFDLAVLGQAQSVYNSYSAKIRAEYKIIPSFLYKKGRKKVLQHFLDKPNIYQTEIFQKLHEKQARENLESELFKL